MRAVFEKTIADYFTGNNLRFGNFRRQDAFKNRHTDIRIARTISFL
jgi:hypothetical protein